jgi:hypothetical protein
LSFAKRALKDKFPTPTVPLTTVLQNRQVFLPDPVLLMVIIDVLDKNINTAYKIWNTLEQIKLNVSLSFVSLNTFILNIFGAACLPE